MFLQRTAGINDPLLFLQRMARINLSCDLILLNQFPQHYLIDSGQSRRRMTVQYTGMTQMASSSNWHSISFIILDLKNTRWCQKIHNQIYKCMTLIKLSQNAPECNFLNSSSMHDICINVGRHLRRTGIQFLSKNTRLCRKIHRTIYKGTGTVSRYPAKDALYGGWDFVLAQTNVRLQW